MDESFEEVWFNGNANKKCVLQDKMMKVFTSKMERVKSMFVLDELWVSKGLMEICMEYE